MCRRHHVFTAGAYTRSCARSLDLFKSWHGSVWKGKTGRVKLAEFCRTHDRVFRDEKNATCKKPDRLYGAYFGMQVELPTQCRKTLQPAYKRQLLPPLFAPRHSCPPRTLYIVQCTRTYIQSSRVTTYPVYNVSTVITYVFSGPDFT